METCETCHGSGAKPGTQPKTCETCHGSGTVRPLAGFFSIQQNLADMSRHRQDGDRPLRNVPGAGRLKKKHKTLAVKIPTGVDEGGDRIPPFGRGRKPA